MLHFISINLIWLKFLLILNQIRLDDQHLTNGYHLQYSNSKYVRDSKIMMFWNENSLKGRLSQRVFYAGFKNYNKVQNQIISDIIHRMEVGALLLFGVRHITSALTIAIEM